MQDLIIQLHGHIMVAERIPYLILAILVTMGVGVVVGPLSDSANPLLWQIYNFFAGMPGDRLNRTQRKRADLVFRGFLLSAVTVLFAFILGQAAEKLALTLPSYGLIEVVFVSLCLTTGAVWHVLLRLYMVLEKGGAPKGAYLGISRSTRIDLNSTDDFGITRTGMGFAAYSFDKGVVAPGFWYLVGGLPVLSVYIALAMLSWRFGKNGFSKGFGTVPLVLEKLMGFVPSLLAGFLMVMASSLTPTAQFHKGLLALWQAKGKVSYEQGGFPLAALAWPLHVSLGGPVQDITGSALKNAWVGPKGATARISHKHLRRAIYINAVAHLLFIAVLSGAYLFSGL